MNARRIAWNALLKMERDAAYSNLVLDAFLKAENPDPQERKLATAVFYGVLERKLTLDDQIGRYMKKKVSALDPEVRTALEMGFYQLLFMKNIPPSAAVNESVSLVKFSSKKSGAGFVNGVLRSFLRDGCRVVLPEGDYYHRLSVETAMPEAILRRWERDYSRETAEALAKACLEASPLYFRVNPMLTTLKDAAASLTLEGVSVAFHPDLHNCLRTERTGDVGRLSAFRKGWVSVQDSASQFCALSVGAKPGERVLDLCGAPGSKSFVMAQEMGDKGEILAFDLHQSRVKLIRQGAKRLSLSCIQAEQGDGTVFRPELKGWADRVLCDVPCSGLGVIRRKPEIRWKAEEELDSLPPLQKAILENGSRYVRTGGTLTYSTCTLNQEENEEVVSWFLERHKDFEPCPIPGKGDWQATLTPLEGDYDGFFVARMRRR